MDRVFSTDGLVTAKGAIRLVYSYTVSEQSGTCPGPGGRVVPDGWTEQGGLHLVLVPQVVVRVRIGWFHRDALPQQRLRGLVLAKPLRARPRVVHGPGVLRVGVEHGVVLSQGFFEPVRT